MQQKFKNFSYASGSFYRFSPFRYGDKHEDNFEEDRRKLFLMIKFLKILSVALNNISLWSVTFALISISVCGIWLSSYKKLICLFSICIMIYMRKEYENQMIKPDLKKPLHGLSAWSAYISDINLYLECQHRKVYYNE